MKKLKSAALIVLAVAVWFAAGAFTTLEKTEYELTVRAGGAEYLFKYPEIDFCKSGLYLKNLAEVVEGIFLDTVTRPTDAEIVFTPKEKNKFSVTGERAGREIDAAKLRADIKSAIKSGAAEVTAEFISTAPKVTAEELWNCTRMRASFSTGYAGSTPARKHNIGLAAEAIDGTVVGCGEEFSFNAVVGKRTAERGFEDAGVIVDGRVVEGVGGGVCQASTTVYNAALLAGLNVAERHPHSLAVGYVEPSFDAMVSDGTCDLRLVNCTGGPVFIEATADGEILTITIYGLANPYAVRRVSTVLKTTDPGYEWAEGEEAAEGEAVELARPKQGIASIGKVEYFEGGKLIKTVTLGRDNYKAVKGKLGRKPRETCEKGAFYGQTA